MVAGVQKLSRHYLSLLPDQGTRQNCLKSIAIAALYGTLNLTLVRAMSGQSQPPLPEPPQSQSLPQVPPHPQPQTGYSTSLQLPSASKSSASSQPNSINDIQPGVGTSDRQYGKMCVVQGCTELFAPSMWKNHLNLPIQGLLSGSAPEEWLYENNMVICSQ
eukprot:Em0011g590a